ncbi:hypothetical protein ILUMI_27258 [Ignelater luminosus]|uniref:PiggyBac transposable element-derived protein domain-containing protein n=1 Tax=Ignelater luminosus TaxID=2038154 RepID=A0A8K0C6I4_IGNLU|nr:hypothetical protein ILUMI_27258 [Ignelater luminosus]
MNRSRRDIPELVKSSRGDLYETVLLKTDNDNCILTVYQAKPNKNVLLLSTLHTSVTINTDEKKKKPETVLYYSDTKYGVDVANQMAGKDTVKASSRRWPVHIFYNILDFAAINAYIYTKKSQDKN